MKPVIMSVCAFLFASPAFANPRCVRAAEAAAYKAWYKPGEFRFGRVLGGTEVIWSRGGVTSYRVTIEHRKPDSSTFSYNAYYVRMDGACRLIRAKKY